MNLFTEKHLMNLYTEKHIVIIKYETKAYSLKR